MKDCKLADRKAAKDLKKAARSFENAVKTILLYMLLAPTLTEQSQWLSILSQVT